MIPCLQHVIVKSTASRCAFEPCPAEEHIHGDHREGGQQQRLWEVRQPWEPDGGGGALEAEQRIGINDGVGVLDPKCSRQPMLAAR
jgi:hypothetical protein